MFILFSCSDKGKNVTDSINDLNASITITGWYHRIYDPNHEVWAGTVYDKYLYLYFKTENLGSNTINGYNIQVKIDLTFDQIRNRYCNRSNLNLQPGKSVRDTSKVEVDYTKPITYTVESIEIINYSLQ